MHDVDEDLKTVADQGGRWLAGNTGGVALRYISSAPIALDHVASSTVEFLNYTDLHVVDEDERAIICKGGRFDMLSASGLFRTDLFDLPNNAIDSVASRRNIIQHDS